MAPSSVAAVRFGGMPDQVQRVGRPGKTDRHLPRGDQGPPIDGDRLPDAGGRDPVPRPGRDRVDPRGFEAAPGLGPTAHDAISRQVRQSVGETFGQALRRPVGDRQRPVDHQGRRSSSRARPGRQGRPGDGHARSLHRSPGRRRRQRDPRPLQGWGRSTTRGEQQGGRQPDPAGCRGETESAKHREIVPVAPIVRRESLVGAVRGDGSGRQGGRSRRTIQPRRNRQGRRLRRVAVEGARFGGLEHEGDRQRERFRGRVSFWRTGDVARARKRAHPRGRVSDPGRVGPAGNGRLQGGREAQDRPIANMASHRVRRARIDEDPQRPEEGEECHSVQTSLPPPRHVGRTPDNRIDPRKGIASPSIRGDGFAPVKATGWMRESSPGHADGLRSQRGGR